LQLSNTEGIHNIRLSNIIYLKSENSYTITCIKNQPELIVSKPLSWFEELLSPFGFIRIHSRWLINLFHLQTCCFTANGFLVKMSNEEELKVSRAQKQNLLDALNSISVFNKNKIAAPSTVNQK
jgi:two-component system, LytTR family, response regulator